MMMNFIRIFMVTIICGSVIASAGVLASDISVIREIHPVNGPDQGLMEVVLTLDGMKTGGIIEKLPDGVVFQSSSVEDYKISQSGNNLIFAVMNDSQIHYLIKTTDSDPSKITGMWEDIIAEKRGEISNAEKNSLPVNSDSVPHMTPESPGFQGTAVICALTFLLGIIWRDWL